MKKSFLILVFFVPYFMLGQDLYSLDTISYNKGKYKVCDISFENPPVNYVEADCDLVMDVNSKTLRTFDEIKMIQNQLIHLGYKVEATGVLDLKTVEAYSENKKNRINRYKMVSTKGKHTKITYPTEKNFNIFYGDSTTFYKDEYFYLPYGLYNWQEIKNFKGKCSVVYILGKKPKTYMIPCNIIDKNQNFKNKQIKELQYKLVGLGYDIEVTGYPDVKTFDVYAEYENKKSVAKINK